MNAATGMNHRNLGKVLLVAAVIEIGTGLVLLVDPTLVVKLLIGTEIPPVGMVLARCFGIALIALGLACWPVALAPGSRSTIVRGMLLYNALIALYLGYLAAVGHVTGVLLWPAIALHGAVAALLALNWRGRQRGTSVAF